MTSPDTNTRRYSLLDNIAQPIRRMNWIVYLICGGFALSGIRTFWDWARLLAGQQAGVDLPTTYGSPVSGVVGLIFCVLAVVLVWFGFKTPELRQWRVTSIAGALILISWGCQRWLSAFFEITVVDLALVISPLYAIGALLISGWIFWSHRNPPLPDNDSADLT